MNHPYFLLSLWAFNLFLISISPNTNAQNSRLFNSDEPLEIVVKTDLRKLVRSRPNSEDQEGEITLSNNTYPIRLKARDNYNRDECIFPPVDLNFNNLTFEDQSFQQLKKMKMVNACKEQTVYEQYILREYLIYRTFNMISGKSFKVRLLEVNFVDERGKVEPVTRYGFVMEDEYAMARRLGGMLIKQEGLHEFDTNREQIVVLSIFQFLIGNTEWQVSKLHNLILLKFTESDKPEPYAIPYDFDYSGMVNASYATPSRLLGIKSVRERIYRGKCFNREELRKAIKLFIEKKASIFELYQKFEFFTDDSRDEALDYLESFYEIIEDEDQWTEYFIDQCKS
jgi:hypothetical protein